MENIYDELKRLTQLEERFYSSFQEIDGYTIENFSYRLGNYEMFASWNAKEMRGIAYIYGNEITEPQLFTLGYHKFFNYGEWNTLEEVKWREIESIQDKLDGSLVMFWKLPSWKIIAKSKTSIDSFVAAFANAYIAEDEKLYQFIDECLEDDVFPIFEYVWPENRIVVSYEKSELVLLWMRKANWEYVPFDEVQKKRDTHISHIALSLSQNFTSLEELLEKQQTDEGYEWFIVNYTDGYKLKVKLQSYVLKHRAKDDIYNEKHLIDICLAEETDDLKSLFAWDQESLDIISNMEKKVSEFYNTVVHESEELFQENRELMQSFQNESDDLKKREYRKQLAIKNCKNTYFSLLMKRIEGKEIDYKDFVRANIST